MARMNDASVLPPFSILYEKGPCICVQKPAGLLTQAPPGIDNLELQLRDFIKQREQKSGKIYLAIIHRLDRPVSGAIVFCRNVRAAQRLAAQFRERAVRKTYWAIVEGRVPDGAGEWTDHVRKIPDVAQGEVVEADAEGAKVAELHFQVLAQNETHSLLEIELGTGRYHQIRLQCSQRGFPILGDNLYQAGEAFGPKVEDMRRRHIALHARQLQFRHPMVDEMVDVTAPLPAAWEESAVWQSLKQQLNHEVQA
ncbi:RluA family pseudouridine synthase [Bremerella sp. T1]|uniref:RluA family pseudouridine synthase n=1 Tax=Bremerella sp. TYQ1 TaxID=3119568 RepID=UPI001CCE90B5|nr:RNA pseudouridine synthase [Bremerella volcania]UBM36105.1 RNA pseudouridine synthase [Bremerella volcania]